MPSIAASASEWRSRAVITIVARARVAVVVIQGSTRGRAPARSGMIAPAIGPPGEAPRPAPYNHVFRILRHGTRGAAPRFPHSSMAAFGTERVLSVHHWNSTLFSFTTTRDP